MALNKKIIYIVIDSFHPRALRLGLSKGKLPALSFLIERGHLNEQCVSVFPTSSPACTSTLATGAFPSAHGIPGFVWYHRGERRIIDYGSTWLSIIKNGLIQSVQEYLFNLNHKQLSWEVRTIYETLEAKGLNAAAVNPLIYRGNSEYQAHIPLILKLLTLYQLEEGRVYGPKGFCLGQFYQPPGVLRQLVKDIRYWRKFGVNDKFSFEAAAWFLQQKPRPDFLSIYLPDTDGIAHAKNADCYAPCLTNIDKKLQNILDCFSGREKALEDTVFVITGDHAQSTLIKGRKAILQVPKLLESYSQAKIGENPVEGKDVAICSNERSAYIYILRSRPGMRKNMVKCLLSEPNIDQIMWKDYPWYHVAKGDDIVSFRKGGSLQDEYGNHWEIKGDIGALDINVDGDNVLYTNYPNALERITGCLDAPNAGELVVTAKPGYLLGGEGAPVWPGKGAHGSLHQEDSLVPLIISGTSAKIENPRLTDVVPFIKTLLVGDEEKTRKTNNGAT